MKLGHALASLGAGEQADAVFEEAFGLAPDRGRLAEAGEHLRMGRVPECARICRELLARRPDEVNALRLLAKVAGEEERWGRAERLLLRALELAPGFHDARLDLSRVFKQQDRLEDAVRCAAEAVDGNPRNPNAHYLHASMLALTGRHEEALAAYRRALDLSPIFPAAWVGMGHLLKTLGRTEEGIEAYRSAIAQRPNFGEVYWSLANLKTFRFSDEEVADIERRLAGEPLDDDARVHFLFTLGKALEDRDEFAPAFAATPGLRLAATAHRLRSGRDRGDQRAHPRRVQRRLPRAQRRAWLSDPAPIFIVGLPRSEAT
jgi:tetratricopeptide (TPR) repeat protein